MNADDDCLIIVLIHGWKSYLCIFLAGFTDWYFFGGVHAGEIIILIITFFLRRVAVIMIIGGGVFSY